MSKIMQNYSFLFQIVSEMDCVTTTGKNDSVYYTCPDMLDSHHSSLRHNSGQIAISTHSSLQYL